MKRYLFCLVCLWVTGIVGCAKQVETKTTTVTHTDTVTKTTPEKTVTVPITRTVTAQTSPPPSNTAHCTVIRTQKICDVMLPHNSDGFPTGAGLGRYAVCAPGKVENSVPLSVSGADTNPTTDVIVWCSR